MQRTGIEVKLEITPSPARLERETELALFRVMQESLANVQRHSGSSWAEILLDWQPGIVVLEVRDRGHGVSNAHKNGNGHAEIPFAVGVGIASMQERMKQVGGRLQIKSGKDGTTVWAAVPIHG
jgi:signal transduction histidine kinase